LSEFGVHWKALKRSDFDHRDRRPHWKGDPAVSIHSWEEIINEIERESNACKLKELAKKLNDAMLAQEREKLTQRLFFAMDQVNPR
jgi:hypothetical protein